MLSISKITPDKNAFIAPLGEIYRPVEKLYFYGTLPAKRQPTVAIVGSRKPTNYGREMTHKFAFTLAKQGVIIVSGLALGIDALAHRACLEADGITLAVLGSGLNNITPASNQPLAREILKQGGAILSEYEPTMPVLPHQFLERNRIVSGLADAVIIIEAARRSGTLSTAAHALEQGRDVFAVPGNLTSPNSEGCNNLIKQGATLLTDISQVLQTLGLGQPDEPTKLPLVTDPIDQQILKLISGGEQAGDKILAQLKISVAEFNLHLTMLELQDIVRPLGNNRWSLK